LTNALKFTPAGGRVVVEAAQEGADAVVRVRDSGRGLAPDEIPRLFKPFSQVHERSEVAERGTGLGLYISKGIVEAHGGRIGCASEGRGSGSTFSFWLPTRTGA
jgi:signal transduction histidine kinase